MFSKGTKSNVKDAVLGELGIARESRNERYLGLPVHLGASKKKEFEYLKEKIWQRIQGWKERFLSKAGKEILIKAIAQAIPTYVMGVFKLPFSVCDDLTKLIRNYWWGVERGKRKMHWLSWPKLNRSKQQGGLGFRDMRVFNQALLARQAWRLLEFPDSLVAGVLKARYYPNGELFDTVFTGNPSSTWSAISHGLELLKKGLIWRVGNGRRIRVWRDSWVPRLSHCKVLSPRHNCRVRRVSELIDEAGQWKAELIRETFLPIDVDIILKLKPSRRLEDDVLAWQPESSGIFSVRSAYKLGLNDLSEQQDFAASSGCPDGADPCWTKIWKSSVPPKVKLFAWKAASNCLATEENKRRHNMQVTGLCNICKATVEDVAHALYACPHAHNLWMSMRQSWSLPVDSMFRNPSYHWFKSLLAQVSGDMIDATLLVAWRAWHARNEVTHNKPLPTIEGSRRFLEDYRHLVLEIQSRTVEDLIKGKHPVHSNNLAPVQSEVSVAHVKPWATPPVGWVSLSVDGSFRYTDQSAGLGMVLRDANGLTIFASCRFLQDCESPLEAETRACAEGLTMALDYSHLPIRVETDCAQLVAMLSSSVVDRSPLLHLVSDVKHLCSGSRECSFVKVERSQVRVSHHLANLARMERRSEIWTGSGPEEILQLLELDRCVILPE